MFIFAQVFFAPPNPVSISSQKEIFPSQPVTVQCNVTRPPNGGNFLLSWECTDPDGRNTEHLVLCSPGPVTEFSCAFGRVYNVTRDCGCSKTVITSNVTFNTTSVCDMLLFCSNGGTEKQQVSASVTGIKNGISCTNYKIVI